MRDDVRKFLTVAAAFAAFASPASAAEPFASTHYLELAGIYWTRSKAQSAPLWSNGTTLGSGDVLNSSALKPGWAPGFDARLGLRTPGNWGVEVGGFILGHVKSPNIDTARGLTVIVIETTPLTAYGVDTAHVEHDYRSRIWGAEGNVTWQASPSIVLLAGIRYISLTEVYSATGSFIATGWSFETDAWRTNNSLWGAQVGARFDFIRMFAAAASPWIVDGDVRVGLYRNMMDDQTQRYEPTTGVGSILSTGAASSTAWSVQGGLNVGYRITDGMALTVGYQALWISKVALAPSQVNVTPAFFTSPKMGVRQEDILFHGARVALTISK